MKPSEIKVVILAGGGDTKLIPLTQLVPKALLPLANVPLAAHLVHQLRSLGFVDLIFCINRAGLALREALGDGEHWNANIHYSIESEPMGTAGALRSLASQLTNAPFFVLGCNLLFRFDLRELLKHHLESGAAVTALVSKLPKATDSGRNELVEYSESGQIARVVRRNGALQHARAFPKGIYCFSPAILDFLHQRESYLDIKEQLLPLILQAGLPVCSAELKGHWRYIYTLEDYLKLNFDVLGRRLGTLPPLRQLEREVWIGPHVKIGRHVNFIPPVLIGQGSEIADGAQIVGPVSIGADCFIGESAIVRESLLWNRCVAASNSRAERVIMADDARLPSERTLQDAVVVGQALKPATINLLKPHFRIKTIVSSMSETIPATRRRRFYQLIKRALDVGLALFLFAILLPLMLVIALAIRIESGTPILFRQRRCGLHGREFTLIKFRSMLKDADQRQHDLRHLNELDGPVFKITKDPRLTKVGKFLRKLSFDELPQLINILRGEMSFVGPRPLTREELRLNPAWWETRLHVKPGLTGLWQINGRSDSSFQDWIAMDTYYAMNQSLALDLKILLKTPLTVIFGSGAY